MFSLYCLIHFNKWTKRTHCWTDESSLLHPSRFEEIMVCVLVLASQVCRNEWHVLAPPPSAVVRCWVEAQQTGERSSDFTAATLVSWISSHFMNEISPKRAFRVICSLMLEPVCASVKLACVWHWDYFISLSLCLWVDDRVFGCRRWARLKCLAGEDKGVESRPAVPPLPVG